MDRQQKIRFLKEVFLTSETIKQEKDKDFATLQENLQKGLFSNKLLQDLDLNLSEEDFDQVVEESPWIVDVVFSFFDNLDKQEPVNFGEDKKFEMKSIKEGVSELMEKFKQHEKEQKFDI